MKREKGKGKSGEFTLPWCFARTALVLFVVTLVTGIGLWGCHRLPEEVAYTDSEAVQRLGAWGFALTRLHKLAADGLLAVVVAHVVRVFLAGMVEPVKKLHWLWGAGLAITLLLLSFTGKAVAWGQVAFWEGQAALGDEGFPAGYLTHSLYLPLAMVGLLAGHLWVMHRRRGISRPL